uniref:Uncharacterized protein n=1 Tax=Oryza punctata TaxID=4537 RepID=A0A0E0LAK7_ORYPU
MNARFHAESAFLQKKMKTGALLLAVLGGVLAFLSAFRKKLAFSCEERVSLWWDCGTFMDLSMEILKAIVNTKPKSLIGQ